MAEKDWLGAKEHSRNALAILEKFEIPTTAWRIHTTAANLGRHTKTDMPAETHRKRAEAYIRTLAESLPLDEPLRHSFLSGTPVSRILSQGMPNKVTRNRRSTARSV
jgi:hypothetical protein